MFVLFSCNKLVANFLFIYELHFRKVARLPIANVPLVKRISVIFSCIRDAHPIILEILIKNLYDWCNSLNFIQKWAHRGLKIHYISSIFIKLSKITDGTKSKKTFWDLSTFTIYFLNRFTWENKFAEKCYLSIRPSLWLMQYLYRCTLQGIILR